MKKLTSLLFFVALFFFPFFIQGQEIIEHNGDTLITITPGEVKTMNSIIVDLERSKDIISLQKKMILEDSIVIVKKDSIMVVQKELQLKKEDYYISSIQGLEKSLKKEKRKRKIWAGILGSVAVILGVLAIK